MGFFREKKPDPTLWDTMTELSRDMGSLRAEMKQLQLSWDDTFDKIRRLTGRLAKRDALDARRKPEDEPPNGDGSLPQELEIDPISQKILNRRNRGRTI